MTLSLAGRRSLLFLPASNPRAIIKARDSAADAVVLDLEDAVKSEAKVAAREAAVRAVDEAWPMPVGIRINGEGSNWHLLDLESIAASKADFIVVPRTNAAHFVEKVGEVSGKSVLAMIETAAGVLAAAEIAPATAGLIAGTNDLAADLRLPGGAGRAQLQTALQLIVLAARAAAVAVFDGVYNPLEDAEGLIAEAEEGRRLGFDGKTLIHPSQIASCNRAFAPNEAELDRARRLIAAYDGGAQRFEGAMVEAMHVEAARRALERSGH